MENESEKELNVADSIDVEEEATNEISTEEEFSDTEEQENVSEEAESSEEDENEESEEDKITNQENLQTQEQNAKFAKIRREAEKEARLKAKKEVDEAYQKGKLDAYKGKLNPFTQTEIKDLVDIEVYEDMYKISENGGDPLKDYSSYVADKNREEARLANEKKEREIKAQQEIDDFSKKYPDVNLNDLFKDEMFKDYAEGKNKSLTETYESFNKLKNSFRNKGIETAKKTIANSISSPGSLNSGSEGGVDYKSMSKEDFKKELEKVKEGF